MNGGSVGTSGACCSGAGVCQNFNVFSSRQMFFPKNDFIEVMMELHDEIDPKKNINKICYHIMCEYPDYHFPLDDLVGVQPMYSR